MVSVAQSCINLCLTEQVPLFNGFRRFFPCQFYNFSTMRNAATRQFDTKYEATV